MRPTLLAIAALFLLTACDSLTKKSGAVTELKIQENLKAPCGALPLVPSPATMADLHRHDGDVIDEYNLCAARHSKLVDALNARGL